MLTVSLDNGCSSKNLTKRLHFSGACTSADASLHGARSAHTPFAPPADAGGGFHDSDTGHLGIQGILLDVHRVQPTKNNNFRNRALFF
mmetsp:Transcript_14313/g.39087  ORF Transcript_14313/g.39087 Transcript_14313/m.39087 type:complete len:88 (+) Transcript_14313:374-637(+)